MSSHFTRREFVGAMALAALAPRGQAAAAPRLPVITFTKPFQNVSFERTAEIVAEAGWSGIECPVRAKGQVLPERVEDDLPRLHQALTARGLTLSLVTTDVSMVDPLGERVLRAAASLGVKRYRLAYRKYDLTKPIAPQLAEWKAQLRDLAALNRQLGIRGGFHNHSGRESIGAPVWDIWEMLHDLDPEYLGACFDIGHATVEGGLSWPIQARLMEGLLTCVVVKDFHWEKGPRGWEARWGPLGEGMVQPAFFDWLRTTAYTGPISQHCEYLEGDGPEQLAAMKKDRALLARWLHEE